MEANNVADYLLIIKALINQYETRLWYRGQSDANWTLKPSIWRNFDRNTERHIVQEYLFKAKSRIPKSPIEKDWPAWLSLMQHYRLPTRLLDWSRSPLIALYFALEEFILNPKNISNHDAIVWILNPGKLNVSSGLEKPYVYSIYNDVAKSMILPAFTDPKWSTENNKIMAVSSIENDIRMIIQQSTFTIHSSMESLDSVQLNENYLQKIIIPRKAQSELAFELDVLGLNPSYVFPDLENLAIDLKNKYLRSANNES